MESQPNIEEQKSEQIIEEEKSQPIIEQEASQPSTPNPYLAVRIAADNSFTLNPNITTLLCNELSDSEISAANKLETGKIYGLIEIKKCVKWSEISQQYGEMEENENQVKIFNEWIENHKQQLKDKVFIQQQSGPNVTTRKKEKQNDPESFDPFAYGIGQIIQLQQPIPFHGSAGIQQIEPAMYRAICNDENVKPFNPQTIFKRIMTGSVDKYSYQQMINQKKHWELRPEKYEALDPEQTKPELDHWNKQLQNEIHKSVVNCVKASMSELLQEIHTIATPYYESIAQKIYREIGPLEKYCEKFGVSAEECKRYVNSTEVASQAKLMKLQPRSNNPEIKNIFEKIKIQVKMQSDFKQQQDPQQSLLHEYLQSAPQTVAMNLDEEDEEEDKEEPPPTPLQQPTKSRRKRREIRERRRYYSDDEYYADYSDDEYYTDYSDDDYDIDPNRNTRRRRRRRTPERERRGRREAERERSSRRRRKRQYKELGLAPLEPPKKKGKESTKGEKSDSPQQEEETKQTKKKTRKTKTNDNAIKPGSVRYVCGIRITFNKTSDNWRKEKIPCPLADDWGCTPVSRTNFPKHFWQHVVREEHENEKVVLKKGVKLKFNAYGVRCSEKCKSEKDQRRIACPTSAASWANHLAKGCGGHPEKPEEQQSMPKWAEKITNKKEADAWLAAEKLRKAKKKEDEE